MKKLFTALLALSLAAALAACGTAAPASSAPESQPEQPPVQLGNPYVTLEDEAAMEASAGFEVSLPGELPAWVTGTVYRAMPEKLAEILYQGEENELRLRIAPGSEDISGVYGTEDTDTQELTLDGRTVTLTGTRQEDGSFTVRMAVWTDGGRSYSLTSPAGEDSAVFTALIEAIR